jgi:hypothetical protein
MKLYKLKIINFLKDGLDHFLKLNCDWIKEEKFLFKISNFKWIDEYQKYYQYSKVHFKKKGVVWKKEDLRLGRK